MSRFQYFMLGVKKFFMNYLIVLVSMFMALLGVALGAPAFGCLISGMILWRGISREGYWLKNVMLGWLTGLTFRSVVLNFFPQFLVLSILWWVIGMITVGILRYKIWVLGDKLRLLVTQAAEFRNVRTEG
jgi:hypothetical protein